MEKETVNIWYILLWDQTKTNKKPIDDHYLVIISKIKNKNLLKQKKN